MNTPRVQGDEGFGLYIHWPFCLSKCPYCDFNSHVADRGRPGGAWRGALLRELAHFAEPASFQIPHAHQYLLRRRHADVADGTARPTAAVIAACARALGER